MDTQVGIVGAGPAGLLLAHLLAARRASSRVVLEARTREYVEHRVRAGVLEQGTVDVLTETGVADRAAPRGDGPPRARAALRRPRPPDRAVGARGRPRDHRLRPAGGRQGPDRRAPGRGRRAALRGRGDGDRGPRRRRARSIRFGDGETLRCAVVAGCDGFHGVSRAAVPDGRADGLRARVPVRLARDPGARGAVLGGADLHPPRARLRAAHACARPRSRRIYLQVAPGEDLEAWPDERIWEELQTRMATRDGGFALNEGEIFEKGDHADALVRRRADAPRPAVPRRRRRAHRARHRRQGPQPRRRRRARARARAARRSSRTATSPASTPTRSAACAASGACSTSRGG